MTHSPSSRERFWGIVPAAGTGRRFGGDTPKQYSDLLGQPVLAHSIGCLLSIDTLEKVVVAIHPDDGRWRTMEISSDARVASVAGGRERADSVLAALESLQGEAERDDWVLVHDAVRPCVNTADIEKLIGAAKAHAVGGLLACPVSDTLKRAEGGEVVETVDRSGLWRALTPQMFRYGLLVRSLRGRDGVTDESSALEQAGYRPLIVEGSASNIKITHRADLALGELILRGGNT